MRYVPSIMTMFQTIPLSLEPYHYYYNACAFVRDDPDNPAARFILEKLYPLLLNEELSPFMEACQAFILYNRRTFREMFSNLLTDVNSTNLCRFIPIAKLAGLPIADALTRCMIESPMDDYRARTFPIAMCGMCLDLDEINKLYQMSLLCDPRDRHLYLYPFLELLKSENFEAIRSYLASLMRCDGAESFGPIAMNRLYNVLTPDQMSKAAITIFSSQSQ